MTAAAAPRDGEPGEHQPRQALERRVVQVVDQVGEVAPHQRDRLGHLVPQRGAVGRRRQPALDAFPAFQQLEVLLFRLGRLDHPVRDRLHEPPNRAVHLVQLRLELLPQLTLRRSAVQEPRGVAEVLVDGQMELQQFLEEPGDDPPDR